MYCNTNQQGVPTPPRLPLGLALVLVLSLFLQTCQTTSRSPECWLPAVTADPGNWRWRKVRREQRWRLSSRHRLARLIRLLVRCALVLVLLHTSNWVRSPALGWGLLLTPVTQTLTSALAVSGSHWAGCWARRSQSLYQICLLFLFFSTLGQGLRHLHPAWAAGLFPLLLGVWCTSGEDGTEIQVATGGANRYQITLRGAFTFVWQPRDSFELRMLILFVRQLRSLGRSRPCLTQSQVAEVFATPQSTVSIWESQVRQHGWHYLSDRFRHQLHSQLPDAQLSRQILRLWVPAFWLSAWEVREQLIAGGVIADRGALDLESLHALARHTGFAQVRQLLLERFQLQEGELIAREQWWLRELVALNERLLAQLAQGQGLTPQETLEIAALRLPPPAAAADAAPPSALPPALQQTLFQPLERESEEEVRCTYCGSDQVAPKSKQARLKRVLDQQEHWRQIAVLRYYCHNAACAVQSFTHLPAGYLPHSPYPLQVRLLGLEVYVHLLSTYRRAAPLLGVQAATLYRWVAALSPVAAALAAYLGVIRTSGVVGIDDKWVRVCSPSAVPPHGRHPRAVWRYAYFAVDVHSYDLLALELYPQHNDHAVHVFLRELKARGLTPRIVVTDLDPAYGRILPRVFPQAVHHECIFHAIQNAQRQLTRVYGRYYREKEPAAAQLHDAIVGLFRARTRKTVRRRFQQLMATRDSYVAQTPAVACVFDSLERHFPKLINAIENPLIPRTNNATELVIRRFDQHYQSMSGFDSFESARVYLRLFELVYRLTPFAADNPGPFRGRSPLQIAGYDLQALPLADFFSQLKLPTLAPPSQEVVPVP
jgi:hypothetical protein